MLPYLGGFFTAFNFVNSRLSQSDAVGDAVQLAAVLFYTLRHPGGNNIYKYSNHMMDKTNRLSSPLCILRHTKMGAVKHIIHLVYLHAATTVFTALIMSFTYFFKKGITSIPVLYHSISLIHSTSFFQ